MGKRKAIFVAATGQHIGKTTVCLGVVEGLLSRVGSVGFIKPVGQRHMMVGGRPVDNDVYLMRERFGMNHLEMKDMSPVVLDAQYTRSFLDGESPGLETMQNRVLEGFESVASESDFTVVEGTGHMGVGSVVGLNNAAVAKLLDLSVVIVSSGGVGSAFDEISLNLQLCRAIGVDVRGVVLNKVHPDKLVMVTYYMSKALAQYNVPLLGCIPFSPILASPSLANIQELLKCQVLAGEESMDRLFSHRRLVATTSDVYYELLHTCEQATEKSVLVITPAARGDVIYATIVKWMDSPETAGAMMLTGSTPPSPEVQLLLRRANIPALYSQLPTLEVTQRISGFTPKTSSTDDARIDASVDLVQSCLNYDGFL